MKNKIKVSHYVRTRVHFKRLFTHFIQDICTKDSGQTVDVTEVYVGRGTDVFSYRAFEEHVSLVFDDLPCGFSTISPFRRGVGGEVEAGEGDSLMLLD